MDGYIWATIGILLILVELFTTSFFAIFLGIGALITALLTYLKITESFSLQIIVFSVFSIVSVLLFRNMAQSLFAKSTKGQFNEYIGDKAIVEEEISSGKEGKVLYRGTVWIAYSRENKRFEKGDVVFIEEVDGIKLKVSSSPPN